MDTFKLVWKGETIETDLSERDAVYLRHEYNMAYNGGVIAVCEQNGNTL